MAKTQFSFDDLKKAVGKSDSSLAVLEAIRGEGGEVVDFAAIYFDPSAMSIVKVPTGISYSGSRYLEATQTSVQNTFFISLCTTVRTGTTLDLTTRLNTVGKGVTPLYYNVQLIPYNEVLARLDESGKAGAPAHEDAVVIFIDDSERTEVDTNYTVRDYFGNWVEGYYVLELVDRDGKEDLKFVSANASGATNLLGVPYETLIGTFWSDYPECAPWTAFYIDTAKTGAYVINEAFNHIMKKFMSCMVFSPAVGLATMIAVDRTAIWEREQSLRGRAEDMASLFGSMTSGLCIGQLIRDESGKATDMRLDMVNLQFELMEGYPSGSVQGRLLSEVSYNDPHFEKYVEVADSMSKINFEKYVPLSGATLEVHIYSQGDDVVVFSEYDITEKVKSEKALAKSEAELAEQLKTINESIEYASVIQRSLLPEPGLFEQAFSDYSIKWEPRDVVGGDIYWLKNFEAGTVLCVADCTGHGTPGALLTMLVMSAFDDIVTEDNCSDTAQLVWNLDKKMLGIFSTKGNTQKLGGDMQIMDGCDIAVLFIAKDKSITLSSCNTQVFVCDGKEVERIKGQHISIGEGKLKSKDEINAINIPYSPDKKFYIASDGLYEQPGGEREKKYGYKDFERIILENHNESQAIISKKAWNAFENYRGKFKRVDDFELITFKL